VKSYPMHMGGKVSGTERDKGDDDLLVQAAEPRW
jgi:hypothetical protein